MNMKFIAHTPSCVADGYSLCRLGFAHGIEAPIHWRRPPSFFLYFSLLARMQSDKLPNQEFVQMTARAPHARGAAVAARELDYLLRKLRSHISSESDVPLPALRTPRKQVLCNQLNRGVPADKSFCRRGRKLADSGLDLLGRSFELP